jgi:hypothetical protein
MEFERLVFVPVIVTTSDLSLAHVRPADISTEDGTLSDAEVSAVPWVRFRKSFGSSLHVPARKELRGLAEVAEDRERTVFVVKASKLDSFLTAFGKMMPSPANVSVR